MRKFKLRHNLRPASLFLVVPIGFGILAAVLIFNGNYQQLLSSLGAARLTTKNWQVADAAFIANKPPFERKFAYYKVLPGQTLAELAEHFGVSENELINLNRGSIVAGTTIKIPHIEQPFVPVAVPSNIDFLTVQLSQGSLYVANTGQQNPQAILTIPSLMRLLQPYHAIVQNGPKEYQLLIPIYIKGNIRLDITSDTVTKLALKSGKNYAITALTLWDADALIEDTTITSFDPSTSLPDTDYADGRSFVRAYGDSRMDIIRSRLNYLGMSLDQAKDASVAQKIPFVNQGGIYGVSWRIPNGSYGQDITTGWVQDSNFSNNYIGSFTFGASGMTWSHNLFSYNQLYGLDPHDDSNNALIEYNTFAYNKKHGFIVSKRCDYNLIQYNTSFGNGLHGFMLHEESAYNLVANNVAYNNLDNYVIYNSSFNELKNNNSYNPKGSNVRIDTGSSNDFLERNVLSGGKHGVYVYRGVQNIYISGNTIQHTGQLLMTADAHNVLFIHNTIPNLSFKLGATDRIIFGPNTIR